MSEPAEMGGCLFGGFGYDGHFQASANNFGNVPARDALFTDRVIPGACDSLFEGESVQKGGIEEVHCGPAILPVADKRRDALFTSQTDQVGDEALFDGVVNLRKAYHRHTYTARCERSCRFFRSHTRNRVGTRCGQVVFSREASCCASR